MFKHILCRVLFSGLLIGSTLTLPACQSTGEEEPQWLTGESGEGRPGQGSESVDPASYATHLKHPASGSRR